MWLYPCHAHLNTADLKLPFSECCFCDSRDTSLWGQTPVASAWSFCISRLPLPRKELLCTFLYDISIVLRERTSLSYYLRSASGVGFPFSLSGQVALPEPAAQCGETEGKSFAHPPLLFEKSHPPRILSPATSRKLQLSDKIPFKPDRQETRMWH